MPCNQCGTCCKLFLINLSEEEYESKQFETVFDEFFENYNVAFENGAIFLKQKENGECIYFDATNDKCSIYPNWPQVCKEFFCDSNKLEFQDMIRQINITNKN